MIKNVIKIFAIIQNYWIIKDLLYSSILCKPLPVMSETLSTSENDQKKSDRWLFIFLNFLPSAPGMFVVLQRLGDS